MSGRPDNLFDGNIEAKIMIPPRAIRMKTENKMLKIYKPNCIIELMSETYCKMLLLALNASITTTAKPVMKINIDINNKHNTKIKKIILKNFKAHVTYL
ncbi:MAG: hypothetical protein PHU34_05335 [Candidatus Methanoperedens sp.]|nr:hypothetical protein [Candidatus Methanoperedens sp.]